MDIEESAASIHLPPSSPLSSISIANSSSAMDEATPSASTVEEDMAIGKLNDSDGRVHVAIRIRPLSGSERLNSNTTTSIYKQDEQRIIADPNRQFLFDHVADGDCSQTEFYQQLVRPLIQQCIMGYNCTVLAYGQTGSGKTHTMLGEQSQSSLQGMIPRAVMELMCELETVFSKIQNQEEDAFFEVYVSFIELYQEYIIDLLSSAGSTGQRSLSIREDGLGGVCVAGATEERVQSAQEVMDLLQRGALCRTTKSTDMNISSSRSHAIFTLLLRQRRPENIEKTFCTSNSADGATSNTTDTSTSSPSESSQLKSFSSKMHFVDLAGSERLKRTHTVGQRQKEAISINSGLLALGNVISALCQSSQQQRKHIPYRDSKLTRLLQDSLGGNSRTLMIACVSPSSDDLNESINTLRYAQRARNIRNCASINEDAGGVAAFEVQQLRRLVAALRQEVLFLKSYSASDHRNNKDSQSSLALMDGGSSISMSTPNQSEDSVWKQRCSVMETEKTAIQAERDFLYQYYADCIRKGLLDQEELASRSDLFFASSDINQISIIEEHLNTIRSLQDRLSMQSSCSHSMDQMTSESITATPTWFRHAQDLIEKSRAESLLQRMSLTESVSNIQDSSSSSSQSTTMMAVDSHNTNVMPLETAITVDLDTSPSSLTLQMLQTRLDSDRTLREALAVQLENAQTDAIRMRQLYEERHQQLLSKLSACEAQRDQAIARFSSSSGSGFNSHNNTPRSAWNRRSSLGASSSSTNCTTNITGTVEDASSVRNMRIAIAQLRAEKTQLSQRLSLALKNPTSNQTSTRTVRPSSISEQKNVVELQKKYERAVEAGVRYKRAYDFQRTLLGRRAEQFVQAKTRVRQLAHAIQKHDIPLSPSVHSLLLLDDEDDADEMEDQQSSTTNRSLLAHRNQNAMMTDDDEAEDCSMVVMGDDTTTDGSVFDSNPTNIQIKSESTHNIDTASHHHHHRHHLGSDIPRSVLRMSPLIPRRSDMFARLADAASLSLANHHLKRTSASSSSQLHLVHTNTENNDNSNSSSNREVAHSQQNSAMQIDS